MLQSFSTNTGTPRCFSRSFLSGTSFQPSMLGAKMTVPAAKSTAPGAPMPTPATCLRLRSASSTASWTQRAMRSMTASTPRWDLVLSLAVPMHSREFLKTPGEDLGAAEINADDVFCFAAGFGHRRGGCLLFAGQHGADLLRRSALMASAERMPSTMVKP